MLRHKCLLCYKPVTETKEEFHKECSRKLFSTQNPPPINVSMNELEELAKKHTRDRIAIAGVQPKLSIDLQPSKGRVSTKTNETAPRAAVSVNRQYILKAPSSKYPNMVELEDLTMHLAEICKIQCAAHGLVRLQSGELAYITRRFDRDKKGNKFPQEDLCQISGLLTENKYNSSMEKVGKLIKASSMNPGLDAVTFLEINVFSFLVGNADMHTKNFSILTNSSSLRSLSPAYDLLATKFLVPEDREESALAINGKKAKLKRQDFEALGKHLEIPQKAIQTSIERFARHYNSMIQFIDLSFVANELKKQYKELIAERSIRLEIS